MVRGGPTKEDGMEKADLEKALDVLLWLYEEVSDRDGIREEISHVRNALYEAMGE